MASMEELYNTIADIWDSYDIYRQEHADKYDEAEESPSTDEIERTVDALYSGWFHINAFFCLGICTGNVFGDKLSEMKKQRDAVEKIAFDPSRILSTPKNGKGVNSDTAETQEPQTYSNLKERFFIMLVTAQKRAEINDMLLGTFDYTKEKVLADRVMDIRVLKEFGKNELYKKEISFEEFTELLRFGSDEDKLCLWRGALLQSTLLRFRERNSFRAGGNFPRS